MDVASAAAGVLVGLALVGGVILFICGLLLIGQSLMWIFGRLYGYWKDRQGGSGAGAGASAEDVANDSITKFNTYVASTYARMGTGAGAGLGSVSEVEEAEEAVDEVDSSPQVGWKALHLVLDNGQVLFKSQYNSAMETTWSGSPPKLIAVCGIEGGHTAPNPHCSCGIYSVGALPSVQSSFGPIRVRIRHFGRVIVGEHGVRSQIAVIEAVEVPRCRSCWRRADVAQIGNSIAFSCGWHYWTYSDRPGVPKAVPVREFLAGLGVAEVMDRVEPDTTLCPVCGELYPTADRNCFNCAGAWGGQNGGYYPAHWENRVLKTQVGTQGVSVSDGYYSEGGQFEGQMQVGAPNPYWARG